MRIITLGKVAMFQQGNRYTSTSLLSIVSTIERCIVNWDEWFEIRLHAEMIIVQRKAREVRNNLIGLVFTLVAKHYITLKYIEEDEEESIAHLQCPKKTRKRMLGV
jgi:hypothetical protein